MQTLAAHKVARLPFNVGYVNHLIELAFLVGLSDYPLFPAPLTASLYELFEKRLLADVNHPLTLFFILSLQEGECLLL